MEKHPLDKAAFIIGTNLSGIAKMLGVSRATINYWKTNHVPAEYCPEIERLTNRKIRCETLNPKINWRYVRNGR